MRAFAFGLATIMTFATCTAAMATVGSHAYNRALSERRAAAVKAEMIRLGVPEDAIYVTGDRYYRPAGDKDANVSPGKAHQVIIELGK